VPVGASASKSEILRLPSRWFHGERQTMRCRGDAGPVRRTAGHAEHVMPRLAPIDLPGSRRSFLETLLGGALSCAVWIGRPEGVVERDLVLGVVGLV
jgi:hypothetical protein